MKKVFFALLILSAAGAGVLVWLMRSSPADIPQVKAEGEAGHGEGHGEGLHIVDRHEEAAHEDKADEGKGEHGEGEEQGEKAAAHGEAAETQGEEAEVADTPSGGEHESAPAHGEAKEEAAKAPPALAIRTEPPGAKVWVDGKMRGETPLDIPLLPKTQMVQIEAEGFEDFTRVAPSDTEASHGQLNWKIQLKEKTQALPAKKGVPAEEHGAPKHAAKSAHGEASHAAAAPAKTAAAEHKTSVEHKTEKKAEHAEKAVEEHAAEGSVETSAFPKDVFKKGKAGPYVIQMKSVERVSGWDDSVKKLVMKYRDDLAQVKQSDAVFGCPVDIKGSPWVRVLAGPYPSKAVAKERLEEFKKVVPDAYMAGAQVCKP